MSKAFTRESDDTPDFPARLRPSSALPPGTKNYITAGGARRLREDLDRLLAIERPQLAASDDADVARRRQLLDQRILQLEQSLQSAVVVERPPAPWDRVRFGASVKVRDRIGNESDYRIVGVDETDIDRGWVSWLSPIARALLNARLGERVKFKFPSGEEELEIVSIGYE
jgi:transcription elongation factor GreB